MAREIKIANLRGLLNIKTNLRKIASRYQIDLVGSLYYIHSIQVSQLGTT